MRDDNNMNIEHKFVLDRAKVKRPRKLRASGATDLSTTFKKRPNSKGNAFQNTHTGARSDLGNLVARSSWEANVMRVLKLYQINYEFETKTFFFPPDSKGRVHAYLPDFYLPKTDEFIEVKGYLDSRGRNKLRKFKKNYPDDFAKLIVIISKANKMNKLFFEKLGVKTVLYYEHLSKLYKTKIENWEGI